MEEKKELLPTPEEENNIPEEPSTHFPSGHFIGAVFCFFFGILCFGGGFLDTAPMGLALIALGLILALVGLCNRFAD